MRRKKNSTIYLILFIAAILISIFYYREYLFGHIMEKEEVTEVITVSSLIEPNADDSNVGRI